MDGSLELRGSTTERDKAVLIVIRVPIYAASSWTSIVSLKAAQFLDPIRDIYEVLGVIQSETDPRLTEFCAGVHHLHVLPAAD